ncbi:aminotransferase class V-fold PLP-dependent enzyme [Planomicrobium sp. YIM 101495]|uniref:aminotransferase class V-fold PLP-dependent enzyme n=1 Tax=Planomicrobium sp. YIM 101495 TaxID=2665160 RepID=UPI0012B71AB7|nr:aminotransferase class V-fold PLP-dependent enzyme [Planomicrobium sp. YIM 101495]MTD32011.1 aminotransferase class V-fold PLP-dependent enzyme [Planomicrobium sp. YIM 101495]
MKARTLTYKLASEPDEMEGIHRLNYETFVEEIPQHQRNRERRLVDKFDKENIYLIAKDGEEVVGMIAVRNNRPFSLDHKLEDLDRHLPEGAKPCEVRLLSVKKEYRKTLVFYQLAKLLVDYCLECGFDVALISGTDRQLRLYTRIGFQPFAEMVGTEGAMFQPMYLTKERFETTSLAFSKLMQGRKRPDPLNFLPGPVPIHKEIERAFSKPAVSHRAPHFIRKMQDVRRELCRLVNAEHAQIAVGTGTLANDLVAAQIKRIRGKGLILANGEFGHRLIDHAARLGLQFDTLEKSWHEKLSLQEIEAFITEDTAWLWTVHCETSTGFLYDLEGLKRLAKTYSMSLCIDACSSVGIVPVDLEGVHLASTVSGKALASFPGLAVVFHREPITPDPSIPRYLDLGQYAVSGSIPYTHSSNLVAAFSEALKHVDVERKAALGNAARNILQDAGIPVLGDADYSPGILTIPLEEGVSSKDTGDRLRERGIIVSYESDYLLERNWIQFALMGAITLADFERALGVLQKVLRRELVSDGAH